MRKLTFSKLECIVYHRHIILLRTAIKNVCLTRNVNVLIKSLYSVCNISDTYRCFHFEKGYFILYRNVHIQLDDSDKETMSYYHKYVESFSLHVENSNVIKTIKNAMDIFSFHVYRSHDHQQR